MQHSSPFSSKTRYFPDRLSACCAAAPRSLVATLACIESPCKNVESYCLIAQNARKPCFALVTPCPVRTHESTCWKGARNPDQFLLRGYCALHCDRAKRTSTVLCASLRHARGALLVHGHPQRDSSFFNAEGAAGCIGNVVPIGICGVDLRVHQFETGACLNTAQHRSAEHICQL